MVHFYILKLTITSVNCFSIRRLSHHRTPFHLLSNQLGNFSLLKKLTRSSPPLFGRVRHASQKKKIGKKKNWRKRPKGSSGWGTWKVGLTPRAPHDALTSTFFFTNFFLLARWTSRFSKRPPLFSSTLVNNR